MDFANLRQVMVDSQVRVNDVTSPEVVSAFSNVPREVFVPKGMRSCAYAELEIETSEGRAMWLPRDLGKILRGLEPQANDVSLVIGAGAGYAAALLGFITDAVIALEDDDALVDAMTERFAEIGMDEAVAVQGELSAGLPDQGPFDVILVAGMVETVPQAWLDQLSEGGRLGVVVATGRSVGAARIFKRAGDTFSYREAFECCPPVLPGFEKKSEFVF
ncbi:MAG: protein-L-isoaspartate O-methyltransferase [Hyphomonas sp.]|nr:protein-L-isoaspartate O-methyltransferase [Hyphomonas sp.]